MNASSNAGRLVAAGREDVRVQYRVDLAAGPTGFGNAEDTRVGIAVDLETTGKVLETGAVIELAMRRFRFDSEGLITHIDHSRCWKDDPGFPIPSDIVRLTGIDDDEVAGRRIDEEEAVRLLRSATIVVAHNASFDRPWLERRLGGAGDLAWACAMTQIDWPGYGFDGLGLGYLLRQTGWFHEAHRGASDVNALIQLLRHRFDDGRTAMSLLVENAMAPSWIFRAVGASFAVKDLLKDRTYRWDPERRTWWKEVSDDARTAEEFWLASNVYSAGAGARAMAPQVEEVTSLTRFR